MMCLPACARDLLDLSRGSYLDLGRFGGWGDCWVGRRLKLPLRRRSM